MDQYSVSKSHVLQATEGSNQVDIMNFMKTIVDILMNNGDVFFHFI